VRLILAMILIRAVGEHSCLHNDEMEKTKRRGAEKKLEALMDWFG